MVGSRGEVLIKLSREKQHGCLHFIYLGETWFNSETEKIIHFTSNK